MARRSMPSASHRMSPWIARTMTLSPPAIHNSMPRSQPPTRRRTHRTPCPCSPPERFRSFVLNGRGGSDTPLCRPLRAGRHFHDAATEGFGTLDEGDEFAVVLRGSAEVGEEG